MRPALLPLYAIVGLLSVTVVVLWFKRDWDLEGLSSQELVNRGWRLCGDDGPALDQAPSTTNADADRRLGEMSKKLDDLMAEVEHLKASSERSPLPTPSPTEAEFVDRHRTSVVQIMDEEQRKRDWEKAAEYTQALAGGMADRCRQPDSVRPALREFGSEYMRRVGAILDEFRSKWREVDREATPERVQWDREWRDIHAWAQGRLWEIDSAHAQEMWEEFRARTAGLSYQFMPH